MFNTWATGQRPLRVRPARGGIFVWIMNSSARQRQRPEAPAPRRCEGGLRMEKFKNTLPGVPVLEPGTVCAWFRISLDGVQTA